jgi:hypothetical protein
MAADLPPEERPRCTATSVTTGERCKRRPRPGANTCVKHGSGAPQVRDAAARRVQEQKALTAAQRLLANVDLSKYADPFAALEFAVGYSYALAERLAAIVSEIPDDQLRYPGKAGEQLRGEVTAAQHALDSVRHAATDALKLGLAEKRVAVQQQTVDMMERALDAALEASGIGLDGMHAARQVFRANIRVARPVQSIQAGGRRPVAGNTMKAET